MIEKLPLIALFELLVKYVGRYATQGTSEAIGEAIKEPITRISKMIFLIAGAAIIAFSGIIALFVALVFFLRSVLGNYMMAFLVVGIILVIVGAIVGYGGYTYGRKDRKE